MSSYLMYCSADRMSSYLMYCSADRTSSYLMYCSVPGDILIKYRGNHSYLYNIITGTTPVVVHGNGPIKVSLWGSLEVSNGRSLQCHCYCYYGDYHH